MQSPLLQIAKSSRHSKITGNFGEALLLYSLSKYGFECASVDHTGIDLIARNPHTHEVMGISVKSRCRAPGKENEYLRIPADEFDKAQLACDAFGCVPYFAIIIDAGGCIRVFLTSMEHLLSLYPRTASGLGWQMSERHVARYCGDAKIIALEFHAEIKRWWSKEAA